MMKENELRVGVYIYYCEEVFEVDAECIKMHMGDDLDDAYRPIQLTEEWLLKFGFEVYKFDHKENQYRFKDRLIVIRDNLFCDYGTGVIIKHVHQLQNLYFALTGEELKSNN